MSILKNIKKIKPEDTYFIRKEVLRKDIDLPFQFDGDFDTDTFHLGAFYNDKLVGVASFMKQSVDFLEGSQYQLRGMATLEEVRGLGFGNLLLDFASNTLKTQNIDFLWCNAREVAIKFYQKNNFEVVGESFEVHQVGTHFKMYTKIK